MIIKVYIHQEDLTVFNAYASNQGASKYFKQLSTDQIRIA